MSVSVSMPQLGESVTEGTVTRWLKREGEHVNADEPLLEVSTDKVDTEIPSPVSGVLRGITVAEDETVAVGAELAVIDPDGAGGADGAGGGQASAADSGASTPEPAQAAAPPAAQDPYPPAGYDQPGPGYQRTDQPPVYPPPGYDDPRQTGPGYNQQSGYEQSGPQQQGYQQPADQGDQQPGQPGYQASAADPYSQPASYPPGQPAAYPPYGYPRQADGQGGPAAPAGPGPAASPGPESVAPQGTAAGAIAPGERDGSQAAPGAAAVPDQAGKPQQDAREGSGVASLAEVTGDGADGPYVTPLVRKLAAEHGIDLARVTGTGVGGRIRKQDVLDAARLPDGAAPAGPGGQPAGSGQQAPVSAAAGQPAATAVPAATAGPVAPSGAGAVPAGAAGAPRQQAAAAPAAGPRAPVEPSSLRGRTERLSRARQVIAQRMVESLQTAAQLTTVIEADVTAIARLRDRAKTAFEAREGVRLSFLPFFALAAVEALKVHPELNAIIDQAAGTVTYHDAEHLGIAVDTARGLMVPVIRNAGDLNIGGLARKIADLAQRTRAGQVSPDDLAGGTFTLTNTGSRGALFDTPIINQPQVGILGTGTVDRRAVVVTEPDLGEVITVRSIVHLALTYDHRLVDGADAARFLVTVKNRLEEGSFEAELGL